MEGGVSGLGFDEVIMVDWSAAATPRVGSDSIWFARGSPGGPVVTANWPTRVRAICALEEMLDSAMAERRRVLVGFDFAFGYPAGFASRLGTESPTWERVWRYLASRIVDGDDNANTRFEVAAELNRKLGLAAFWGCPRPLPGLSPKLKVLPDCLAANPFPSLRQTDRVAGPGIRSVWQLYGGVTVGSQVLMGVPYLQRLRDRYRERLLIWPQQTGFVDNPLVTVEGAQILMLEIWPTALRPVYGVGSVRDEQQVRWCTERCLQQQEAPGGLGPWFAPRLAAELADTARAAAVDEEGWILGVGSDASPRPPRAPSAGHGSHGTRIAPCP